MASIDLIKSCLDSIRQISDQVEDSVIYLDAGCLEAFQFFGAFPLLLDLGVRAVCSLENVSPLDLTVSWNSKFLTPTTKVVVITSRLLSDAHRHILRCLDTHKSVLQCIIYTSISEVAHSAYVDSPLGPDAFHEYESLLLQDYEELVRKHEKHGIQFHAQGDIRKAKSEKQETLGSEDDTWSHLASSEDQKSSIQINSKAEESIRLHISVHHFPMILCPLSPRVFILPSEGTFAEACLSAESEDSLSPGLPSISAGLSSDEDVPPGVTLTANFLYHLAEKMDLKMEIFSLGATSKTIGKMLTDMSSLYDVGRRHKRSAGLLLIDRTLDLLTPCCHGDSFLDRLLYSLPRAERSSSLQPNSSKAGKLGNQVKVQQVPLDIRIPFKKVLSTNELPLCSTQLSEGIAAFMSGWTSSVPGSESPNHADKGRSLPDQEHTLLNGSFLSNYAGANYLEVLLDRRGKDGAMMIKKWLLETLQHDNISVGIKGRLSLTSSDICTMLKKLAPDQISVVRNRTIIKLALASEIALSEPNSSHWDAFVSAEKLLTISSLDSTQSLSSQIRDLINTSILPRFNEQQHKRMESSHGLLSFQNALLLSMVGYILAGENFPSSLSSGPFSWEEEHSLKEAIVDAILENPSFTNFRFLCDLEKELEVNASKKAKPEDVLEEPSKIDDFDDQWGSWDDDDMDKQDEQVYGDMQLKLELRDRVDQLFKFFNKLSSLKWRNPVLREGLVASNRYSNDTDDRKSLLYKLLAAILSKYDVPGLEHHSSAVGRLLKSGLGRFGLGQAKPSFGDQTLLLVFVVGGINSFEVREAMQAVMEYGRPDTEFVLGGTTLLTPNDMFDLLLGCSSYI